MSKNKAKLKLTITPDRTLAYHRGGSMRYLACTVKTPHVKQEKKPEQHLNLALVIDASGSMQGYPLQAARDTALELVKMLHPNDVLSVVSFADDFITHLSRKKMDEQGKWEAEREILRIEVRGCTDLAGGWFEGAKQATRAMDDDTSRRNHLILLSDGHANRGITNPDELATHAGEMRERGLYTSTVGIGEGYSITQLQVLAEAGGGRMHDAQHPHEIAEVVMAELGEVRNTFASDIRLVLDGPNNTSVDILESYPLQREDTKIRALLGSLPSDSERTVIWRIMLPKGEPGETINLTARCSWTPVETDESHELKAQTVEFKLARSSENSKQERDQKVSFMVAQRWHAQILREAMNLNRIGRYREASDFVETQLKHFERYCRGIEGTTRLVRELQDLTHRVNYDFDERSRKEVQMYSHKLSRNEKDFRIQERLNYSDYLK